jgi:hypothetical protein
VFRPARGQPVKVVDLFFRFSEDISFLAVSYHKVGRSEAVVSRAETELLVDGAWEANSPTTILISI